jgi:hypothetical protein
LISIRLDQIDIALEIFPLTVLRRVDIGNKGIEALAKR